jgi:hypothetical protein
MTAAFARTVYNMATLIKHGKTVTLVGNSNLEIKSVLKFAAHIQSRLLSIDNRNIC